MLSDKTQKTEPRLRPVPVISVIVPVHNRLAELEDCLESLCRWRTEECELILVDDHSTGNVREIARRYEAHYFRTPEQQGPAGARNLGARHASGEILVFVDADVVIPLNALHVIRREFDENPELTALFGSFDDIPGCEDFFSSFKTLLQHHVHQASRPEAVTFWSGCGAIRKEAFEAVGGFNADRYTTASIEDIELGLRLVQQQQKVRLVKSLQVKHLKRWTLLSLVRTDVFQRAIPWTQLILRTGYLPSDLNLAWPSRLSAMLIAAVVLLTAGLVSISLNFSDWSVAVLATALVSAVTMLLLLNRELYVVFWRKRGASFTLRAIVAHWAYLFYSALTFTFCWAVEPLRVSSSLPVVAGSHPCSEPTSLNLAREAGHPDEVTRTKADTSVPAAD